MRCQLIMSVRSGVITLLDHPFADGAGWARRKLSRPAGNALTTGLAGRGIEVLFRLHHQHATNGG